MTRLQLACALLAALALPRCAGNPSAGDACASDSPTTCDGKSTVLVCVSGKFVAHPCVAGCNGNSCDYSQNAAGTYCDSLPTNGRCRAADTHAALDCGAACQDAVATFCERNVVRELPCRGQRGCRSSATTFSCDTSLGNAGDECSYTYEGTAVCGKANLKARLTCLDGGLSPLSECATWCAIVDGGVGCAP